MKKITAAELISLIINGVILVIEAIIIPNCFLGFFSGGTTTNPLLSFRFFTEDSNLLLGISSLVYLVSFLICRFKDKPLPQGVKYLRLVATTATTTTFMVVLLLLNPYCWAKYQAPLAMYTFPNMFFTHLLCPILTVLSFVLYEEAPTEKRAWKQAFWTLTTVVSYAIIVGTLASLHLISSDSKIDNVYGFMDVTAGAWWVSPLAFTVIISGTYGEEVLLAKLQQKREAKRLSPVSK